jgi:REP element-mobilizing transposase RayT
MWNDTDTPLAYLITFRCHGTWLHGDERGSIDRFHHRYQSPYISPNPQWLDHNKQQLKDRPLLLNSRQRAIVESAVRETCEKRKWCLEAINVRTNHVHAVVSIGYQSAERALAACKANATRQLRERMLWSSKNSPWAEGGSKRYLWNEQSVARAIDYVLNGQGDKLPDFD